MKILLVDDSNEKIAAIVKSIQQTSEYQVEVETVVDVYSALKKLEISQYDLLLIDLHLPIRSGRDPQFDGGQILIREIERKSHLKSPKYIMAITQYEKQISNFHEIWPIVTYSQDSNWQIALKKFIVHINQCNTVELDTHDIKPTVFVEGTSDKIILMEAFKLFDPKSLNKIRIKTVEQGGGAAWVANQVVAWAHLFHKDKDGKPIKCVGLFDGDTKGNNSRRDVNRVISNSSEMNNHFSLMALGPDFARHIIPLYQKGLSIPVTLEEMFPHSCWEVAQEKKWLSKRTDADSFLQEPRKWDKFEKSLSEHIGELGISEADRVFLQKLNADFKMKFANMILNFDYEKRVDALANFEQLVKDIVKNLFG